MADFVSTDFGAYTLTLLFAIGVGINIALGARWVHVVANLLILAAFACLAIAFSARFPWMVPEFLLVAVAIFVLTDASRRARRRRDLSATAVEQEEPGDSD